ncbi:hypothetical protein [Ramlibacter sp.]|uniref:hypothetical protein n=1 Tax=Ramlibacter sp. TaxID=1917967 RepID=UPI002607118C|nr:hypothetical protein [Ramlibacter sp.]MDB5954588.1 hypothetical protein [Ramlibacter sp.]
MSGVWTSQRPEVPVSAREPGYPPGTVETTTPAAMGTIIRKDIAFWGKLLRDYNVEPQ